MIPKSAFNDDESKKELDKIKKIEDTIDREKLVYKACRNTDDFRKFQTIRTFGKDIYNGITILEEADKNQSDLLNEIKHFNDKTRTKNYKRKQEKEVTLDSLHIFFEAREMVLNGFKSKIFPNKSKGSGLLNTDHSKLKILTPKKMLQTLPIALAQVKAGNNSENLLNEIRQFVCFLYQSKQITKKVCNNLIKKKKKWILYL